MDPSLVHSTAKKGGEHIVFITYLTIRVKGVGLIRHGQIVVIVVVLAGGEITGKFRAARMAAPTSIENLRWPQFEESGIGLI